ncbi:hypothetical protein GCM10009087_49570 [Sphingomonas oligophenolica]|uniref:DUF4304 domain-containing protein n=1 Tax=Sphingomonas oligophenolica TaxID=301154 RepID=A0ABU9YCR6_9SPHN
MKQPDRTLVSVLDPFMTEHGFKYVKSRDVYIRKTDSGLDDFSWSSFPLATGPKWRAGYYEGQYGLGLRNDAVEEITRVAMPIYGADNQRYAFTVYRSVGGYFAFDRERDRELCLRFDHLEEDVKETVQRIEAMLSVDGFAWYKRYADPVTLSRDLNDPIATSEAHPLQNNPGSRPLVGVAAACVAEPGRVPELIEAYLNFTSERDKLHAHKRPPEAPDMEKKLLMIVERARELGYEAKAR